jgi:hypothetical protein
MYQLWILGALDNVGGLTKLGSKMVEYVFDQTKDVRAQVLLTDDDLGQLAFYKKLKMQNTRELVNDPLNCFVKYDFELS